MTSPSVTVVERDAPNAGATSSDVIAVVGVASTGPVNQPTRQASTRQLTAVFESGPLVEASALIVAKGKQVLACRVEQSAAGTAGTLAVTHTGTSAITLDTGPEPADNAQLVFRVVKGGTIGAAGITYQVSADNGANFGSVMALGTENSAEIASGVILDFGTGTLVAGDTASVRTTAPTYDGPQLTAALTALAHSSVDWDILHVVGPITTTLAGVLDTAFAQMAVDVKPRMWIANTRLPNAGEAASTYLTAMEPFAAAYSSSRADICMGGAAIVSPVTGYQTFAPASYAVAAEEASVEPHIDTADTTRGPLSGVSLRDSNGNPVDSYYDETVTPGGDDLGFTTLRSWGNLPGGAYINRPRLKTSSGTIRLVPHRRVANLAHRISYSFFQGVLSKPLRVDAKTGFLLPVVQKQLESGCTQALTTSLMAVPYLSALAVHIDNTVNLIPEDAEMQVFVDLTPLAYVERIRISLGFTLQTVTV